MAGKARHGDAKFKNRSRLYIVWGNMIARCENPNHPQFRLYGGRGIRVCQAWHYYPYFRDDMGYPKPGMTLDRINNEGGYEPGNCRWVSHKENCRNTRLVKHITLGECTRPFTEWCEILGVNPKIAESRMRRGEDAWCALTRLPKFDRKRARA